MACKEKEIEKLYRNVGEVADELGVQPFTIRFWEQELKIQVKRSIRGDRKYTRKDIDLVREVQRLLKAEGYTIAGARRQLVKAGLLPEVPVLRGRPPLRNEEIENMLRVG